MIIFHRLDTRQELDPEWVRNYRGKMRWARNGKIHTRNGMPRARQRIAPGASGANTKVFQVGDDLPAINDLDGGGQGWLASTGNPITDLFEQRTISRLLNFFRTEVSWQGSETLAHGTVAIVVFSVTVDAVADVQCAAIDNGAGVVLPNGGSDIGGGKVSVLRLAAGKWHRAGGHDANGLLVGTNGRGFPHAPIGKSMIIINKQAGSHGDHRAQPEYDGDGSFHLFPFVSPDMLPMGQGPINGIGGFTRHVLHRPVIPIRLPPVPHHKKRKKTLA